MSESNKFHGREIRSLTREEWVEVLNMIMPSVGAAATLKQIVIGIEKALNIPERDGYIPDVVKNIVWQGIYFGFSQDKLRNAVRLR